MPTETINDNPFCDVDFMPLAGTGNRSSVVRLKNDETGEFASIPHNGAIHETAGYRLVPNTYVRQLAEDVLTRTGKAFEPLPVHGESKAANIVWDGKSFSMSWYLPKVGGTINGNPADRLMLGVRAINSYIGASRVGVEFFIMRVLCLNQFNSGNLLGSFTYRHLDIAGRALNIDISDATNQISLQAEKFAQCLPRLRQLQKTEAPLTEDYLKISGALQKVKNGWPASYEGRVNAELRGEGITSKLKLPVVAEPNTLWGILNAYTAVSTHDVGGFRGAELSEAATDYMLSRVAATAA